MPVYSLKDIGKKPNKSKQPTRGRRLGYNIEEKSTAPEKKAAKKTRKEPTPVPAPDLEDKEDENDEDNSYVPPEYDYDSASDASSEMSVEKKDFEQEVEEITTKDEKMVTPHCPNRGYKLIEKEVKNSSEFAEAGDYTRNQRGTLLTEIAEADVTVNSTNAPTVDYDLQTPDHDVGAKYAIAKPPGMTEKDFLASIPPGYIYKDGPYLYEPLTTRTYHSVPFVNGGKVGWEKRMSLTTQMFSDGSIPLRRRKDLENAATKGSQRPNKRKRDEGEVKDEGKEKVMEEGEGEQEGKTLCN